ncbi:hypothetical protein [Limosilactobacillus equigenerosi]|uniref:hypothetical protein n=1 Tax=Limosilactobacillus equigenerosi TaxID=417373 RepID=UPI0021E94C47|nr:hypothetical protein [Limosilactobacillus equigenerosi]
MDQFVQRATYYRYVGNQAEVAREHVYFQTKAETAHVAVAAASIVARYYSLQAMDELSQQAGLTLPIGAGHAVDVVAARLLERGQDLSQFAKVHFGNTKKAHAIYQQR